MKLTIVTLAASSGLSEKEIEKMVKNAEEFAEVDKQRKMVIEQINSASSIIHETEKAMNEHKDKIDAEETKKIREKIASLQALMADSENANVEAIKEGCDEVQQASLKLFQKVYESRKEESSSSDDAKEAPNASEAEFKDAKKE